MYKYDSNKKNSKNTDNKLSVFAYFGILKDDLSKNKIKINDVIKKIISIVQRLKFKKLIVIGGINTEDYVKNAYITASINTIICMIINKYQKNFNFNKLYYQFSISDYSYYLALDTIISFSIIQNIYVLITLGRLIKQFKKSEKKKKNDMLKKQMLKA